MPHEKRPITDKTIVHLHPAMRDDIGALLTRRPLPSSRLDQVEMSAPRYTGLQRDQMAAG